MIKDSKKDLPGQGNFFDLLYPDRVHQGNKSTPGSDTTDDVKEIFGSYTCVSLKFSSTFKNADAYGQYCEVLKAPCVYPECSLYQPVKQ